VLNSCRLLGEFEDWNREGKIAPIEPRRVFDAVDIVDAFRYMQTGTHISKIVVRMPDSAANWHCNTKHIQVDLQGDAVYLLVGGLGGLGRAIARQGDARFGIYYGMETQGEQRASVYKDWVKLLVGRIEAEPSLLDEPEFGRELTLELGGIMTDYMPSTAAADMSEEQVGSISIDSLMAIEIKSAIRRSLGVDITLGEINKAGTVRGLAQLAIVHLKAKYGDGQAVAS
jgi:acyl carrier protein